MKEDVRAKIIAHAWKNEAFRKQLLTNPRAALKEFGVDVPNNVDLKVIAEEPGQTYCLLPPAPSNSGKLSEAELAKTAAAVCGVESWLNPISLMEAICIN
jgi:hypothetical protein